jgi:transitional endoplasmic reticulum ATPase
MMARHRLTFITVDPTAFADRVLMASVDEPDLSLGDLLTAMPALCTQPMTEDHLRTPVSALRITAIGPRPDLPGYLPPGLWIDALGHSDDGAPLDKPPAATETGEALTTVPPIEEHEGPSRAGTHPEDITEREAVLLAHRVEIERAASYLEAGLSVLVRCEKMLVSHLSEEIAARAGRVVRKVKLEQPAEGGAASAIGLPGLTPSRRNELLDTLLAAVLQSDPGNLVVVPHLDLLAGGNDATLTSEARELVDAVYEAAGCVLLAFVDPSLSVPEVLANRFAVRVAIEILPRIVRAADGQDVPIGRALVTRQEAELFRGFDEIGLYKHVAGLNAIRLRHALRFAFQEYQAPTGPDGPKPNEAKPTFRQLVTELQTFKAKTSSSFEVPNVSFGAIGGYEDVKAELMAALEILGGAAELPEHLRTELVPRGFIFHGPPGTGKTLFAKAAASSLGATIMVVSGPEITDKYVGESERKIRELFAEARRNAPSVVVFDEFDSIAVRRSGNDDGGSRAGNAIVAQLLTELDGFRPEVPVLIIGTTNRLDLIDDALLRPSRFRPIQIGLPELNARREIAAYHASHFGVEVGDLLLGAIATATDQFSGDDIRSLFRDARAGELVGDRRPADAYRLGELVGQLRRGRQQRQLARNRSAPSTGPAGQRTRLRDTLTGSVTITTRGRGAGQDQLPTTEGMGEH